MIPQNDNNNKHHDDDYRDDADDDDDDDDNAYQDYKHFEWVKGVGVVTLDVRGLL